MATPTPPVPTPAPTPSGQIELVARRLSIVTVRGVSYEFTINGCISDKRCDELVKNHIQYLLIASGRDSFDSIKSTLKKNNDLSSEPFSLEKSEVTYLTKSGKQKTKDANTTFLANVPAETKEKVQRFWESTQGALVELTSGASAPLPLTPQPPANPPPTPLNDPANPDPANPAPPIRQPSTSPTVLTPYKNRAKRLPATTAFGQADVALVAQLQAMSDKYKGKPPAKVALELRKEYVNHIEANRDDFLKEPKFKEIMANLVNAFTKDNDKLMHQCGILSAKTFGNTDINRAQLTTLLSQHALPPTQAQQKDLIKIHNAYVLDNGLLNTNSFVEAFVKIHDPVKNPDQFEVVLIDQDNKSKLYQCRGNSSTTLPIIEGRCAFLCVNEHGLCASIPRGRKALFNAVATPLVPASITDTEDKNYEVLEALVDLYDTYDEASIHQYVLADIGFRARHSHAFDRLKGFIYKRDVKDARPGADFSDVDYGGTRLAQLSAAELASLLKTNRDNILKLADDENHPIV